MPGKRKKFIRKKNAVTYRLVPRCRLDPDGDASEHVLVPVSQYDHEKSLQFNIKLPEAALPPSAKEIPSMRKQIPVKGPQPDWDPDIVATLDDDFNYEDSANVLEDDFIAKANGLAAAVAQEESLEDDESESGSKDCDSVGGFQFSDDDGDQSFFGHDGGDKKMSKLTQYSLTPAVSNCTEEFQTFNDRFEKFFETYDDDQIGALDFEQIEGSLVPDSEFVKSLAEDLEKCTIKLYPYEKLEGENLKSKILQCAQMQMCEKERLVEVDLDQPLKYDCQSILSTYSNKFNHPTLIKAERKEKPVKISATPWKQKLTKSKLKQLDREAGMKEDDGESEISENNETITSSCNFRPKGETPEERKQRKQAVKQNKRENRMFKKQNKSIAKEERRRQKAIALNARRNRYIHLPL